MNNAGNSKYHKYNIIIQGGLDIESAYDLDDDERQRAKTYYDSDGDSEFHRFVRIDRSMVYQIFRKPYERIVQKLVEAGYLIVDHSYSPTFGTSKAYILTDKGVTKVRATLIERLDKLFEEKEHTLRRIKYADSKKSNSSSLLAVKNLNSIITQTSLQEWERIYSFVADESSMLSNGQRSASTLGISNIVTRKFNKFDVHDLTGRIYSPIHLLPKDVKKQIKPEGMEFKDSIDVRCCIASFFAETIKVISGNESGGFKSEVSKWNHFFFSEESPKSKFNRIWPGYSKNEIKNALNRGLNGEGSSGSKKFRAWIKENFPELYSTWNKHMNIKDTGAIISDTFESKIFRDDEVYTKARQSGIRLIDNHDEILIYSSNDQSVREFIGWFVERAQRVTGLSVKFSCSVEAFDIPPLQENKPPSEHTREAASDIISDEELLELDQKLRGEPKVETATNQELDELLKILIGDEQNKVSSDDLFTTLTKPRETHDRKKVRATVSKFDRWKRENYKRKTA